MLLTRSRQLKTILICGIIIISFTWLFVRVLDITDRQQLTQGYVRKLQKDVALFPTRMQKITYELLQYNNYTTHQIDSFLTQNQVNNNLFDKLMNYDLQNADPYYLSLVESWCKAQTENGIAPWQVAKGYDCLLKINSLQQEPIAIYHAIKNGSYALETMYDPIYANNLITSIVKGYEGEAKKLLNATNYPIINWITGTSSDEIPYLKQLATSNNPELKSRALYRLSMIYLKGRSSSLESINYKLELAADLQKQIFNIIKIPVNKTTNVAFIFNELLASYAPTVMASILLNSDLDNYYNFYIIMDDDDPISPNSQQKLNSLQYIRPYKINFKNFPKHLIDLNKPLFAAMKHNIYPKLILFKLMLDQLLQELSKIIVLDIDMLVHRDLNELQNLENFNNYIMAGTTDPHPFEAARLHNSCNNLPYLYVNGGLQILNLDKMRETHLITKLSDIFIKSDCELLDLGDQNLINIAYQNQIKFLSTRWNWYPPASFYYSYNVMPFITHYLGQPKPWDNKYKKMLEDQQDLPNDIKQYWSYWELASKRH